MDTVRFGVIGLGAMGSFHVGYLDKVAGNAGGQYRTADHGQARQPHEPATVEPAEEARAVAVPGRARVPARARSRGVLHRELGEDRDQRGAPSGRYRPPWAR